MDLHLLLYQEGYRVCCSSLSDNGWHFMRKCGPLQPFPQSWLLIFFQNLLWTLGFPEPPTPPPTFLVEYTLKFMEKALRMEANSPFTWGIRERLSSHCSPHLALSDFLQSLTGFLYAWKVSSLSSSYIMNSWDCGIRYRAVLDSIPWEGPIFH